MQQHEVPTHLQAEDKVLIGLTFPQIVAAASVIGLAYGAWRYGSFLPEGMARIALSALVAAAGLALVLIRPGGRALPVVLADLLRFLLMPKRFEGSLADLLDAKPSNRAHVAGRRNSGTGRKTGQGFRPEGPLFRCVGLVLAFSVFLASLAPKVASADPGSTAYSDAERLFIERWHVRDGQAAITVRAAASLEVRVTAETVDSRQTFAAQDVLYQGERREYVVPLTPQHLAIAVAWRGADGAAGIRVLDRRSLPYPLPRLRGSDCTVAITELRWQQGELSGRVASACRSAATEVVDAIVLQDPNDAAKTVRQQLLLDATVEQVGGSLRLTSTGPRGTTATAMPFTRDADVPVSISVPPSGGVLSASLDADMLTTRVAQLPGQVQLAHHPDETVTKKIPVVAWFEGFTTRVSSVLRAVWDPVVHTVSARLGAWFGPITSTISATLQATWDSFYETVGATVSTTVGSWVSAVVGTQVWTTVGRWLTATVGSWVSAMVGAQVWANVGTWLTRTVGTTVTAIVGTKVWTNVSAWLTTNVGAWVSAVVATQVSANVGAWVSTTVGKLVSATVGTQVWTTVSSWLTAGVGTWVSALVGTHVSTNVGTWLSANVGTWVSTSVGAWLSTSVGMSVSTWVGGFYTTVSAWVGWVLGWLNISVYVPSQQASGYASGTASGYASSTASGYASGNASGYASGTASGYASGSASGYASGTASGHASGRAEGYASGVASGYASGTATGYASGVATGQASGTATGYASGNAGGTASGRAEGFASGPASGYASGAASQYASGTATGYASGPASGYATGQASGYAESTAYGYASGEAKGYAEGTAAGYASKQVLVPGRTDSRTVSKSVTVPGQMREQVVSEQVVIPGHTAEQLVNKDVWVPGREVREEVGVEVVIPGYVSAEVVKPEPLVRHYREQLSVSFPVLTDAPYSPVPVQQSGGEGGGSVSTPVDDYVRLLDQQKGTDGSGSGTGTGPDRDNPYREALEHVDSSLYFLDRPDEAALLRSAIFLRWIDGLSVPVEAKVLMHGEAGGVASEKSYGQNEIPAVGINAQDLFRDLVGGELR